MVDSLTVHGLRMVIPPRHAAMIRAETLFLLAGDMLQGASAIETGILGDAGSESCNVIPAAIGLDGIFGYSEYIGNARIFIAFSA